jgi:hypothetical protein
MDTGKENFNTADITQMSKGEMLEKIAQMITDSQSIIEFLKPFASGELIVIPIPRELLLEIGVPEDEDGCIAQVPFQFTVDGKKLIIEQAVDIDFECDGDCEACPFYEVDCDGDCDNCPCSEECDESEVF